MRLACSKLLTLTTRKQSRLQAPCYHALTVPLRKLTVATAKKDKKGSAKGSSALAELLKKKQAAEMAAAKELEEGPGLDRARSDQYNDPEIRMLLFLVCQSYWKATKKYMMEGVDFDALSEAIFRAPFVVLVHNRFQEGVTDPLFTYANKAALTLWEDRQKSLDRAASQNVIMDYEGWRTSLTGNRFKIKGVTLFNVTSIDGEKIGQAAVFNKYEHEDGTVCETTGQDPPPPTPPVSHDQVAAAQEAAAVQGEYIRHLKEGLGLTNQDDTVRVAVAELKARKEAVAALQRRLAEELAKADKLFDDEEEAEGRQ